MRTTLDFARLQTPAHHGDVLVEPSAERLRLLVESNQRQLAALNIVVGGEPLPEVRCHTRRCAGMGDAPLIVTGHQPDFIHAGVWAKHVVASRLAAAMGGQALNLVVDHDAPKQTALAIPDASDHLRRVRQVRYATWPHGAAFEFMPPSDASTCQQLVVECRAALGARYDESLLPLFFEVYGGSASGASWVDQAVAGRRAVERSLGVALEDRRIGQVWCGPLLCDLLCDAPRFAAAYNGALRAYRIRHRVRAADRPVPDLAIDGDRCETALWVYRNGLARRRLFVGRRGDALELFADDEPLTILKAAPTANWRALCAALAEIQPWVIRPRALTLTLWARLMLADLFIHGIGGAKYDRVTDDLVRAYFGVEPPGMACVSATLRWQAGMPDVTADLRRARHDLRDAHYNPERHIDDPTIAEWVRKKRAAVEDAARLRQQRPRDPRARRRLFEHIRTLNERMAALAPEVHRDIAATIHRLEEAAMAHRIASDREYFFAFHPRRELQRLLANTPAMEDFRGAAIV